ncbi:MAG: alpha-ketoglutarate-dependent dioxygenase AlkB family protein [Nitrososphaerales archaeon]
MEYPLRTERSQLAYVPGYLGNSADQYYQLARELPFNIKPEVVVMGKVVHQPRDVVFLSDVVPWYYYSNVISEAKILPGWLKEMMEEINRRFNCNFNAVLANRYNSGEENVGSHADQDKGLRKGSPVGSISFGATRTFRVRDSNTKGIVCNRPLRHGDFMMMQGQFQKDYKHEIPVEKKVKEERISLTFREHVV